MEELTESLKLRGWRTSRYMKMIAYDIIITTLALYPLMFIILFFTYGGDLDRAAENLPLATLLTIPILVITVPAFLFFKRFMVDFWRKNYKDTDTRDLTEYIMKLLEKMGLAAQNTTEYNYGVLMFRLHCESHIWIPEYKIRIIMNKTLQGTSIKIGRLRDSNIEVFRVLLDRIDREFDKEKPLKPISEGQVDIYTKGEELYKFRRRNHRSILVSMIFFVLFFACFEVISAWSVLILRGNVWGFVLPHILTPVLVLFFYVGFCIAFDNIIIFERGIYPSLQEERYLKKQLLRKHTFIPFSTMTDFEVFRKENMKYTGFKFNALGRSWVFLGLFETENIVPIIQEGIAKKHIQKSKHKNKQAFDWDKCKRCGGKEVIPNVFYGLSGKGGRTIPCPFCHPEKYEE